jgi:hypothetical protein
MTGLGKRWRVPKKRDDKGWKLLVQLIAQHQKQFGGKHVRLERYDLDKIKMNDSNTPRWRLWIHKPDPSQLFLDKK